MFSTRFLRGGLKTSVVHVYCSDSNGTRDFRFHWLENEDCEDIAQRFEAQLNQELSEWKKQSPASTDVPAAAVLPALSHANTRVPMSTALHIEKSSNDTADHEVLLRILGVLRQHELQDLLFREQCKYLERPSGADLLDNLTTLDLSSCALVEVPASIAGLHNLKVFVLSKNKLTGLPHFIGTMQRLVTLNADDNTLTSLPDSLKTLTNLHTLSLSNNSLAAPIIDLSSLQQLAVLHLGGNPLTYVPELSQAASLHIVSLAALHISADPAFSSWTVQIFKPPPRVSMRSRSTPVDAALKLLLSRSSLQHPLVAGGLAEMARDTEHRAAMLRAERLLPQLVHAMLAEHAVVAVQSCEALARLAQEPGVATTLAAAATITSALELMGAPQPQLQVAGLKVLAAVAVASEAIAEQALTGALIQELLAIAQRDCLEAQCAALKTLSSLAFPSNNKATLLKSAELVDWVAHMAAASGGACEQVRAAAVRVLAVLGQNDKVDRAVGKRPVRGRGLRVLALDGGGMKGMTEVTMLRELERRTGSSIRDLFDVIGGTSTGCMIAMGVGIMRFSLDDMEEVYMDLGSRVFEPGSSAGPGATPAAAPATGKPTVEETVSPRGAKQAAATSQSWSEMLMRMYRSGEQGMRVAMYGAKHNTPLFEKLLQERTDARTLGCVEDMTVDSSWLGGPKVFGCATHASVSPAQPYLFRTYEFPPDPVSRRRAERLALHEGSSKHRIWQAIRASSAAPYYLDDFSIGDLRFCDGAVTVNNPAVVAVQEARMLYPDIPIDCVVSMGVGLAPAASRPRGMHSYLDMGSAVVESACSVDRPHEALACMLDMSGCLYERLCPVDPRCEVPLDCTDATAIQSLVDAATQYIEENSDKFDRICEILLAPGEEEDTTDSAESDGIRLATRPHCLILSAPATGAAEPPCPVGQFLRALDGLPCTTTRCLAEFVAVSASNNPAAASTQPGVSTVQDPAAFGSVVFPASTDVLPEAPKPAATTKHTPQLPPVIHMPQLPRLHTSPTCSAVPMPQPTSGSRSYTAAHVAADAQPNRTSPAAVLASPTQCMQLGQPPGCGPGEVMSPFGTLPAALSPSSTPILTPAGVSSGPTQQAVQNASPQVHTPKQENVKHAAPEVLEMRTSDTSGDSQHQQSGQRDESDGQNTLLEMLAAMVSGKWSPTNTPPSIQQVASDSTRQDSQQPLKPVAESGSDRGDQAQVSAGVNPGGPDSLPAEAVGAAESDASDPLNPFLDDRSTLADALPAEPDLAAAPRSSFECSDDRLLGKRTPKTSTGWAGPSLPFREAARSYRGAGQHTVPLPPVCEAPAGFVIVGAHPRSGGVIASYRRQFHAVVEPSDEATVLKVRLKGGGARQPRAGGIASDALDQSGDDAVESELYSGRLVRDPGGQGGWWRCMSQVTQQFPDPDGQAGIAVVSLMLQEIVPDRVLQGQELQAALTQVHGAVAVLVGGACEALLKVVLAAGAVAVLLLRRDVVEEAGEARIVAAAEALMHAVDLVRSGRRLDLAMRDSGSNSYFSIVKSGSQVSVDLAA